jgi:hypothetical protein
MLSSTDFWDAQLREGHRLSAVGGSDSHNATNPPQPPGSIGWPTTAVEAGELSVAAILDGIRHGRTFVDLTASHNKVVDFEADSGSAHAQMGGTLDVAPGAAVHVRISTTACAGSVVHLLLDGKEVPLSHATVASEADAAIDTTVTPGAGRHWLRVEVRQPDDVLQLVSSPLYLNFP